MYKYILYLCCHSEQTEQTHVCYYCIYSTHMTSSHRRPVCIASGLTPHRVLLYVYCSPTPPPTVRCVDRRCQCMCICAVMFLSMYDLMYITTRDNKYKGQISYPLGNETCFDIKCGLIIHTLHLHTYANDVYIMR